MQQIHLALNAFNASLSFSHPIVIFWVDSTRKKKAKKVGQDDEHGSKVLKMLQGSFEKYFLKPLSFVNKSTE